MTVDDLIQKLKAQGVTATSRQIEETLGSVEYLTDDDLPSIIEMLAGEAKPAKRKGGTIDKPKSGSIAPLDTSNLPEVSSLSTAEVGAYIDHLEQMDAHGHPLNDEAIEFLLALYDRRKEAIEFAHSAVRSFRQQDQELASVQAELDETVNGSVQTLQSFNYLMQQFASGGARLGDRFRSNTANMRTAADRFSSHVAAQSGSQAESVA